MQSGKKTNLIMARAPLSLCIGALADSIQRAASHILSGDKSRAACGVVCTSALKRSSGITQQRSTAPLRRRVNGVAGGHDDGDDGSALVSKDVQVIWWEVDARKAIAGGRPATKGLFQESKLRTVISSAWKALVNR